jgi:hypothetical protein
MFSAENISSSGPLVHPRYGMVVVSEMGFLTWDVYAFCFELGFRV